MSEHESSGAATGRVMCRRTVTDLHAIGETAEIVDERQKAGEALIVKYFETGHYPKEWPDGIELTFKHTFNHGGGGGP